MLPYDHWRSVPLERFAPLARVEGVRLISLQIGTRVGTARGGRRPVPDRRPRGAARRVGRGLSRHRGGDGQPRPGRDLRHGARPPGRSARRPDLAGAGGRSQLALAARPRRHAVVSHRPPLPANPRRELGGAILADGRDAPEPGWRGSTDRRRNHPRRAARPPRHPRDQGRSDHRSGEAAQRPGGAGEPRAARRRLLGLCPGPRGIDRGAAQDQRSDLGDRGRAAVLRGRG